MHVRGLKFDILGLRLSGLALAGLLSRVYAKSYFDLPSVASKGPY